MANPTYQRIIICDSTDVATRMVAAAETELQPHYLERFAPSVAEAARGWFDQQVGGLSRSPESIAAALIRAGFLTDDIQLTVEQIPLDDFQNHIGAKGLRDRNGAKVNDIVEARLFKASQRDPGRPRLGLGAVASPTQHREWVEDKTEKRIGF